MFVFSPGALWKEVKLKLTLQSTHKNDNVMELIGTSARLTDTNCTVNDVKKVSSREVLCRKGLCGRSEWSLGLSES